MLTVQNSAVEGKEGNAGGELSKMRDAIKRN